MVWVRFDADDGIHSPRIHTSQKWASNRDHREGIETPTRAGATVIHNVEDVTPALVRHAVGGKNPVVVHVE